LKKQKNVPLGGQNEDLKKKRTHSWKEKSNWFFALFFIYYGLGCSHVSETAQFIVHQILATLSKSDNCFAV